jgi:MoxR-like ATPase
MNGDTCIVNGEVSQASIPELQKKLQALKTNLATVIQGKEDSIDILVIALIAGGSVLMEDVPGVGKTTLAKALAKSIDADYSRIQFTPDLLPGDILGSSIYNPVDGTFNFRPGPIFCNILLADEINRASPRTQSALLEAMSEGQATIEGHCHTLHAPFLVLATENPVEYHGTYPLPEAQLDRFLVQLNLGYPDKETEVEILYAQATTHPLKTLKAVVSKAEVSAMQTVVRAVQVEKTIAQYLVDIVDKTRMDPRLKLGVSPRASLMLFRAAQAAAFDDGRDYVLPDDVQRLAQHVLPHRIMLTSKAKYGGSAKKDVIQDILSDIKVPT